MTVELVTNINCVCTGAGGTGVLTFFILRDLELAELFTKLCYYIDMSERQIGI